MKRLLIISLMALAASCSTYSVKVEVEKSDDLEKVKKTAVLLRFPRSSYIGIEESSKSMVSWVSGYKNNSGLEVLSDIGEELMFYASPQDRFLQVSSKKDFLRYKSTGVIKEYLRINRKAVEDLFAAKGLHSLIIYEVDGFFSGEFQYIDFHSLVTVIDSSMNVIYLDYQANNYHVDEVYDAKVKGELLNHISERFVETMFDLEFLEKE